MEMRLGVTVSVRMTASQRSGKILQEKRKKNPVTQENMPMRLTNRIPPSKTNVINVLNVGKASIIVLICVLTRGPTQEKNLISALSVGSASVTALT